MSETTEDLKELSPREKLNQDYNHTIGMLGHVIAQRINLEEQEHNLEEKLKKIMKKASNLPKDPAAPASDSIPAADATPSEPTHES